MSYEPRNERNSAYLKFRASMHIAMGIVYLLLGTAILYLKAFGSLDLDPPWPYIVGGLMIAYGLFRLWRGMADMKLRRQGGE